MSEGKHTPGPWHRNIRANGKYPVVFAGRNKHVAIVSQQTDGMETEANIDLIAAAPELLEALKQWEIIMSADCTDGKTLTAVRKLIAKAEGAQS